MMNNNFNIYIFWETMYNEDTNFRREKKRNYDNWIAQPALRKLFIGKRKETYFLVVAAHKKKQSNKCN